MSTLRSHPGHWIGSALGSLGLFPHLLGHQRWWPTLRCGDPDRWLHAYRLTASLAMWAIGNWIQQTFGPAPMTGSPYRISDLDVIQSALHSVGGIAVRSDPPTVVSDPLMTASLGQGCLLYTF